MNRKLKGKGQLELIGLIVIVVIVITAMMFYVVYKFNNPEVNVKKGFVNREIASNILITAMKTNVKECPHHSLDQLLSDCASLSRRIYCGGVESCIVANQTILWMVNQTVYPLGRSHYVYVENTQIKSENDCGGKEKIQASQALPLSLGSGVIRVVLDICD